MLWSKTSSRHIVARVMFWGNTSMLWAGPSVGLTLMNREHEPRLPRPWVAVRETLSPNMPALETQYGLPPRAESALWQKLYNTETGEFVAIRRTPSQGQWIRITGLVFLPNPGETGFSSRLLRNFPLAAVEAAYNEAAQTKGKRLLAQMYAGEGFDPTQPVGRPDGTDGYYARVAMQYDALNADGAQNPTAALAELNGVSLPTAQRWLAEARKLNFLPPGKRGRRIKRESPDV